MKRCELTRLLLGAFVPLTMLMITISFGSLGLSLFLFVEWTTYLHARPYHECTLSYCNSVDRPKPCFPLNCQHWDRLAKKHNVRNRVIAMMLESDQCGMTLYLY